MTKEPGQPPKAVNIIRPNHSLHQTTSTSSSNSSHSSHNQPLKRMTSNHSSLISSNRKVKVAPSIQSNKMVEKPVLNLYHPPKRKPSYDDRVPATRPAIELYKPQRMTKSMTAPSLSHTELNNSRPISPFHIRPSHRSVLGPINTPVAATTPIEEHKSLDIKPIVSEDEEIEDERDSLDDQNISEEEENKDDEEEISEDEDEPVLNEARVNRKIADLELSINSLMSVNAMLEATVRKQASQLSQFKNKMLSGESMDMILDEVSLIDIDHVNEASEEEEEWDQDVLFQKLRKITESMIEQGQKSINYEYKILGRVLSNYETNQEDEEDEDEEENSTQGQDSLPKPTESPNTATSIPAPSSIPLAINNNNHRISKRSALYK